MSGGGLNQAEGPTKTSHMSSEDSPASSSSGVSSNPGSSDVESEVASSAPDTESEPGTASGPSTKGAESDTDTASSAPDHESEPGTASGASTKGAESDARAKTGARSGADSDEDSPSDADSEPNPEAEASDAEADSSEPETGHDSDAPDSEDNTALAKTKSKHKTRGKLEKFESGAFGTLEEHAASHDFPAHVGKCGPCIFWKKCWKWSAQLSCRNPETQENETWIGCRNGLGVCFLCAGHSGKSAYAKGVGSLLRLGNLKRHALGEEHTEAQRAWEKRTKSRKPCVVNQYHCLIGLEQNHHWASQPRTPPANNS